MITTLRAAITLTHGKHRITSSNKQPAVKHLLT